jgi:hypothetical protein
VRVERKAGAKWAQGAGVSTALLDAVSGARRLQAQAGAAVLIYKQEAPIISVVAGKF